MRPEPFSIFASDLLPWVAGIQLRGLALLALTGVGVLFLRRSSAAMRHLVLSLAALGLFALPLLSLVLPSWSVQAPPPLPLLQPRSVTALPRAVSSGDGDPGRPTATIPAPAAGAVLTAADPSAATQVLTPDIPGAGGEFPAGVAAAADRPRLLASAAALAFSVWALGAFVLLLRVGISVLRLQCMAGKVAPAAAVAPALAEEFSALASLFGLRRPVRLVIGTPEMPGLSPMTWGLWRPVVLLPAESDGWPADRLRSVLLHELAHVQRGDWGTELLARVVCALYWPNPLVWLLVRRLRAESECACDDRVLLAGVPAADYAGHLVEVARGLKARRHPFGSPAVVTMARRSEVGGRVRAILSEHRSRVPATARVAALLLLAASGLLLPLANLRVASAGGQKPSADTTPIRIGEMTFHNGALPAARLLKRTRTKPSRKMTDAEYRTIAATRFAPGSDRFPSGVVAEGLYVSGVQPDGSVASWDRAGNLLLHAPNWSGSGLKAGELTFQIDRLKLPGTAEWIDKTTYVRLNETRAIETEFGVVGGTAGYFGRPSSTNYGNRYFNFTASNTWAVQRPAPAQVDLYLTTSYGQWQTLGESRKNQNGAARVLPVPGGGTASFSQLVTRRGGVEAEVSVSLPERFTARDPSGRPQWHLRLEPLDAAGRAAGKPRVAQYIQAPEASLGIGKTRVLFRFLTSELPFEKVPSVRLLARPMHTVYFRNVPTRPNRVP